MRLKPLIAPAVAAGLLFATAIFPVFPSVAQEAAGFVSTIEDLPLMPGLIEEEGGMVFDSARGRIVDAYATGPVSEAAVKEFYDDTLPQLGWRPFGPPAGNTHFQKNPTGFPVFSRFGDPKFVKFPGALRAPDRVFSYWISGFQLFWNSKIVNFPGALRAPDVWDGFRT